jgi:hypothetical protein
MLHQESHIRNVYISMSRALPHMAAQRMLVIETDLKLPQSRFSPRDPRIDDLLLELHQLKLRNPAMFNAVDTVEIRGAHHNMDEVQHPLFPLVCGERVSSSRAVDMSVA